MRITRNLLRDLLLLVPYLVSLIVPRSERIWVFGSWFGHRFSDNSRYVFDHVRACEPRIRAVWLSRRLELVEVVRDAGGEAYRIGSPKGYWLACRAGVAFVTQSYMDVDHVAISRARVVQLWHGTPLKKIGWDILAFPTRPHRYLWYRILNEIRMCLFPFTNAKERYDLVVSPSETVSPRLRSAFGVDDTTVCVTGYPRGDVILASPPSPVPAVERLRTACGARRIVCYAPTHRQEGRGSVDLFDGLDVAELEKILERHEALFLVNAHYCHGAHEVTSDSGRVRSLGADVPDINLLLPHVDVLVTDYSSVFYDYLLLDRPILFTPFDLDSYLKQDRELYEDYEAATPGPKCRNWPELLVRLDQTLGGEDLYRELRAQFRDRYNRYTDTRNSERVVHVTKTRFAPGLIRTPDDG